MNVPAEEAVFSTHLSFTEKAIRLFRFQYQHNALYKRYADSINCNPDKVKKPEHIPFLPISFFKTHVVATTDFEPQTIFQSSGTTGSVSSKHFVKDVSLYEKAFVQGFEHFYGPINEYCILGLLPSYLERSGSSLVYMVEQMMQISNHPQNGFHLYDHGILHRKLKELEARGQKTLLIGVSYALLDFAAAFPLPLSNTIIMETGGMKGRRRELLRQEVHALLQQSFGGGTIHSEYGMTELLSQAYAKHKGLFRTPPTLNVLAREEDDPLSCIAAPSGPVTGLLNIIDLANVYSCAFIATEDVGRLYPDGSFEVLGRMDNSDVRGCSLMVV